MAQAKIADVVEKYIGELVGQGLAKVRESYDSSKFGINGTSVTFSFNLQLFDSLVFGIQIDLTQVLMSMACPLAGFMYGLFFSGTPSAATVLEKPVDPPLPPQND